MSYPKPMKYVRLGNSGLKVSKIILGCMSYGSPEWGQWVLGEKEGFEHIKFAYDHGITTFDTADVYSNGESEVILGKALKHYKIPREDVVIMTKLYGVVSRTDFKPIRTNGDELGYVNQHGLSRKHIFDAVKASLKRLDVEYVDVMQCHRLMQALHDVVKAGYVRYIGMSSCWAYQFHTMQKQHYAISHNLTPFISMQNHYNLIYREEEREMMPTLKQFGVASIPWSALGRGLLTRPWSETSERAKKDPLLILYSKEQGSTAEIVNRVEQLAKKKNVTMAQVTLAWTMTKVTAPIVGTTSLKHLEGVIESLKVELTEEEIKYLEEPYQAVPVVGILVPVVGQD